MPSRRSHIYLCRVINDPEEQIILRPDWRQQVVEIACEGLRFLKLRRPATLDLILTKMMRGPDPEDMQDVRFYLQREPAIGTAGLQAAFAAATGPDVPDIWQLFAAAQPVVLSMAREPR